MKANLKDAALATAATVTAVTSSAADQQSVEDLIAKIKSPDDNVRGAAWQNAGSLGAPAVKPLAKTMTEGEMEIARAAKRALWKIVRYSGRPGAEPERKAVAKELAALLQGQLTPIRREALWMLSEIGDNDAVKPITALLDDRETREDARASLERIPGKASMDALQAALASVPEEFKPAIANSLRVRGAKVSGYPSQKLVPTRPASAEAPKSI